MDKRALKLVVEHQAMRKRQVRNLLILALAVLLGLGSLVFVMKEVARSTRPVPVAIDPASLPPIRPGPQ